MDRTLKKCPTVDYDLFKKGEANELQGKFELIYIFLSGIII